MSVSFTFGSQQAQSLGNVQHAQHVQEIRAFLVRPGRVDNDHFLDRRLEEGGVGGEDAGLD